MLIFLSPGKKPPLGQFTFLSSPLETHLQPIFVDGRLTTSRSTNTRQPQSSVRADFHDAEFYVTRRVSV